MIRKINSSIYLLGWWYWDINTDDIGMVLILPNVYTTRFWWYWDGLFLGVSHSYCKYCKCTWPYIYIYSHKNVKKVAHPHGTSNPFYGDLGDVLFPYMYTIVIYVIICIYSHGHPVCRNQPKQSSKQEGILGSPVRSPELLTALVKL